MRRILRFVGGAIILLAAAGWLVLESPFLNSMRQARIAALLTEALERETTIGGPVTIVPGRLVEVRLSDVRIPNAAWAQSPDLLRIGALTVEFPLCVLWQCPFEVSHWKVSDALASFEISATGEPSWGKRDPDRRGSSSLPLQLFFAAERVDAMSLRYDDHRNGWVTRLTIDDFTQTYLDGTRFGDRRVNAAGTLNDVPFTYTSSTDVHAGAAAPYETTARLEAAGLHVTANGTAAVWNFARGLDMEVTADAPVLASALQAIGLSPEATGTAQFRARFTGDAGRKLSNPSFHFSANGDEGTSLTLDGSVDDLGALTGFDVTFDADRRLGDGAPEKATTLSELRFTGASGRFVGDLDNFSIADLRVDTNAFDQAVRTIGPIAFEDFRRSETGLLVLPRYSIKIGPEEAPWLTLEGHVGNVIGLKDLSMRGTFDLGPDAFISDLADPKALGRSVGWFTLEPDGEKSRLTGLDLKIVDTDLVSGAITVRPSEAEGMRTATVSAEIPDYTALARAFGVPPVSASSITLDASVDYGREQATGLFHFGLEDSHATGKLTGERRNGRDHIGGVISLPRVDVADVAKMVLVGRSATSPLRHSPVSEEARKAMPTIVAKSVDANVTVLSDDIVAEDETVKDLRAEIELALGVLTVDPLSLDFLDGTFDAKVATDVSRIGDPLIVSGSLHNVALADLFPEEVVGVPVVGNISGDYAMSAVVDSLKEALETLTGTLALSLSDGRIGTNLIEMAGMGPVSFMFSKASRQDFSDIHCAIGTVDFEAGEGTVTDGALETEFIHASINGTLSLPNDSIDMLIESRPIDKPAALPYIPAKVTGTLSHPDVQLIPGDYRKPSAERPKITEEDKARAERRATACERAAKTGMP